jgi:HK97 family phage portal protein
MLTTALVKALGSAQSPRAVSSISWMLEKATGFSTTTVTDWYQRNGYYRLGGSSYESHSGVTVSWDKALEAGAVYAGAKILGEDMGSLPFFLYKANRRTDSIDKYYDHPLFETLHDQANPDTDAGEFVEAMTAQAALCGTAYAHIQRENDRIWLWPWNWQDVRVKRNDRGFPVYMHREGRDEREYPQDQVFHLRGFTLDGTSGDNMLHRARHLIGLTLAAEEYAGRFFSSSSMTHLVLERPAAGTGGAQALGPDGVKLLKEAWAKWHSGLKNAWEPAILQEGMTAKLLQPKHSETQLIEQRTFQVIEVCRILRIPPHRMAELSRATFSNIEQQSIDYATYTLGPWRRRWKQAVNRCLLTAEDKADKSIKIYAEHNVEALQRGDFKTQSEGWARMLEKGVYCINDVLRFLNMSPVEGGDARFIQLNMQTVVDAATGANLPDSPNGGTGVMPVR